MKLARFRIAQPSASPKAGVVVEEKWVVDLYEWLNASGRGKLATLPGVVPPTDLVALMSVQDELKPAVAALLDELSTEEKLAASKHAALLANVELLTPVGHPNAIFDAPTFTANYSKGMAAMGLRVPGSDEKILPTYYRGSTSNVVGHGTTVAIPSYADDDLDFELEVGIFIAREGKNIPVSEARSFIGGYSIWNDISLRKRLSAEIARGMGPSTSKAFDGANVIGPWILLNDGSIDGRSFSYEVRVDGELWGKGSMADMQWTFEELISFFSQDTTLYPGDFIAAGTVPHGMGLEIGRFPRKGQLVRLTVHQIGHLETRFGHK